MKFIFEITMKDGHTEKEYIDAWKKGSTVIQKSVGAQGTVLYRKIGEPKTLIAIASWTSKKARDAAMEKLDTTQLVLKKHREYGEINTLGNFEEIARVDAD